MNKKDKLACEIGTLIYDRYMINAYGITSCNINYTEGDLFEKLIVKSILDGGSDCASMPRCKRPLVELDNLSVPNRFPFIPMQQPNPNTASQTVIKLIPMADNDGFTYIQSFASAVWTINHTLAFVPNVTVVDENGFVMEGSVQYLSQESNGGKIQITFSEPVKGQAYLS